MKKILALMIIASAMSLSGCITSCCSDGQGHCCPANNGTCPFRGYNAWWY